MRFTFVIHRNGDIVLAARQPAPKIRVRRGKTCTTDGPFAETKEQLGGVLLTETTDIGEPCADAAFPSR